MKTSTERVRVSLRLEKARVKQVRVRVAKLLLVVPVDNPVKVERVTNPVKVISLGLVVEKRARMEKKKKITPESVMTVSSMTIATGSRTKTRLLKNGFGSCSQGVRQAVTESLLTTKVCWRKLLASFVKRSQRASKTSTVKKINRRYAYIHPGRKVNRQAQLVIAIDQSGSVGDGMLAAFFTELEKLAKFAEFTVIPFDTKVDDKKAFVWKKGSRRKWERVLSGGTSFEPVREWVDNPRSRGKEWQGKTYDGVLVLTDMEAPKPKAQRTCQRAWVTTERFAQRPYFKPDKRDRLVAIDD